MAIPDFNATMLPVLRLMSDGSDRQVADIIESMALHFGLTDEEREELLPSGQDKKFANRVRWALFYFKKARVLENPSRGVYRIAVRGKELLDTRPADITERDLLRYPEFEEFYRPKKAQTEDDTVAAAADKRTPKEILEASHAELNATLAGELLDRIRSCSPEFFERLVIDLLLLMGYGGSRREAGRAIGRSHDGGIDGIIKEDRLGLDVIYVQAKRWGNTVGRPDVQTFAGSLEGVRAKRGIFITTSTFSKDAQEYVRNIEKRIILIDGSELVDLMIEHNLAVSTEATYQVKRLDTDYFEED